MSNKLMKSMMAAYQSIQESADAADAADEAQEQLDEAANQSLNKALLAKAFSSMGFSESDAEKVYALTPANMRQTLKKVLASGGLNDFKAVIQGGCKGMPKTKLAVLYMLVTDMVGEKIAEPDKSGIVTTDVSKEKTAADAEAEE